MRRESQRCSRKLPGEPLGCGPPVWAELVPPSGIAHPRAGRPLPEPRREGSGSHYGSRSGVRTLVPLSRGPPGPRSPGWLVPAASAGKEGSAPSKHRSGSRVAKWGRRLWRRSEADRPIARRPSSQEPERRPEKALRCAGQTAPGYPRPPLLRRRRLRPRGGSAGRRATYPQRSDLQQPDLVTAYGREEVGRRATGTAARPTLPHVSADAATGLPAERDQLGVGRPPARGLESARPPARPARRPAHVPAQWTPGKSTLEPPPAGRLGVRRRQSTIEWNGAGGGMRGGA